MKNFVTSLLFFTYIANLFAQNQSNMYVRGDINGWGSTSMTLRDLGTDTWIVSITEAETDGTSEFKFANTSDWSGSDWSRGAAVTIGSKTTWYDPNGGNGNFSQTSGKYYTFIIKDVATDNNSEGYIFEFSQTPISISSVESEVNTTSTSAITITVALSGTPDSNERVYIRYTTDNWSSSAVVEGDPSSSSIDINIPGQSAGTTVNYYAFTSITSISNSDADLATISFDNNSGNNYSYYIESGTVTISGSSNHFRMMSSPVAGTVYDDILGSLWIQGMTNGDTESGTANVWTYSGSSWSALSNLNTASQTAGVGFLVYVFANTDGEDDDSDLPVTLSVSGTENSGNVEVPSSGANLADAAWLFAGNPYASTIDWDLVEQTNVTTSAYVWDSQAGTPAYISWNSSSGSLTAGLIAPYQGFWVQGDGGSGGITIAEADKASTTGSFYKTMADNTGSMNFTITSGEYSNKTFVSFMTNGAEGMDNADAYKLLPMTASERVVGISYAEGNGLDISNLPYVHEGSIAIPLDVMYLTVDDDYNFVTNENDVTMTWDISSLPGTIMGLTLTNNTTNETTDLLQIDELTFTTEQKGSFPAYGSGGVNIYPEVGESRFTLTVAYSALTSNDEPANVPGTFALRPAYPNPFNPSTTISFDIPDATDRNTSLHIYDITGKLVETLVNKVLPSGSHAVTWDPKNLSSGLYIVQLKVGNKTFNQKLTFLK
jgi:hypothetical protein